MSLAGGFCAAVSYAHYTSLLPALVSLHYLPFAFYLIALFSILSRVSFVPILAEATTDPSRWKSALRSAGIAACIALIVRLLLPVPFLPAPAHRLEIVATGEKNRLSGGSEVWVKGICGSDLVRMPFGAVQLQGDWSLRDATLVSYQRQPASLVWQGEASKPEQINFLSHSSSGQVRVRWDGSERLVDLYSPAAQDRTIYVAGTPPQGWWRVALALPLAFCDIALLSLVAVAGWLRLRRGWNAGGAETERWGWARFALPSLLSWTIWCQAFWPGILTNDSIDQWRQVATGRFVDWHPVFHTLTNFLLTRMWHTPAAIALTQVVALAVTVGWGLDRIARRGAPRWALWAVAVAFALSPVNGSMVITLWKDIPYSIAVLALTIAAFEIAATGGRWLEHPGHVAFLAGILAAVALFRQNGPVVAFGTAIVMGVVLRTHARRVIVCLGVAVALWLGVRGPLYSALHASSPKRAKLQPMLHQIAAHVAAETALLPSEAAYLETIHPLDDKWRYSCLSLDVTQFDRRFHPEVLEKDPQRLVRLWWDLLLRNPSVNLKHLACSSSLVWHAGISKQSGLTMAAIWPDRPDRVRSIVDNDFPIFPYSMLPFLKMKMASGLLISESSRWAPVLWAPAFYLYLALAAGAIVCVRASNWRFALLVVPIGIQSGCLLALTFVQDFRYQYSVYLVGILLLAAACNRWPPTGENANTLPAAEAGTHRSNLERPACR